MRLKCFRLHNYGCFADLDLQFATEPGRITLITAPNGAGKSVLRQAFHDLLFDIPMQSPMKFHHGYAGMALQADAVTADGAPFSFGYSRNLIPSCHPCNNIKRGFDAAIGCERARRDTTAKARPASGETADDDVAGTSDAGGRTSPGLSGAAGSDNGCLACQSKNLPGRRSLPYDPDMNSVTLPPELEQFAAEMVASGRFRDRDELVCTGVDLVRRRKKARAAFIASLEAAQEEARRDGIFTIDEVVTELDEIIAEAEHSQR